MSRPRWDLFIVSGLILFLELACIRWFPAHVLFLTFFTNTVLLACFVGMSVGCLSASSTRWHLYRTPMLLAVAVGAGLLLNLFRSRLEHYVNVGNQATPDVIFFGTEANATSTPEFLVPVELVTGLMFLLIAAVMIGPGQEMGRAFNKVSDRATAYALNLGGSLAGIVLFATCSWFHLPPVVWFGITALGILYFLLRSVPIGHSVKPKLLFPIACLVFATVLTLRTSGVIPFETAVETRWSPYYRIDYQPRTGDITGDINTNLIGHQVIRPLDKTKVYYHLPYLLNKEMHPEQQFKRILIIGAGSGNDVSLATMWAAPDAKIDAVDIEPVIVQIGRDRHPDKPYADPRVTVHLDDGRNFLRRAPDGEYDLVVYALVDSLVLHSGYGSIRLESYLFTLQAFADVKRVLKPTGSFALYNYFRQGWLAARLRDGLRETFGTEPIVLTDPHFPDRLELDYFSDILTFFLVGNKNTIDPIRQKFQESQNHFWLPANKPITVSKESWFSVEPPKSPSTDTTPTRWVARGNVTIAPTDGDMPPATDEWPFLYTRKPTVPGYILRGIGLMVGLSLFLGFLYRPSLVAATNGVPRIDDRGLLFRSFWLGAGFMLIETKAVVQMALLFGSTWAVNTVVFAAILVMSMLGTLFAGVVKPSKLWPFYIGLFLALGVNIVVPLDAFLGMDRSVQILAACGLVFAPVVFAGVIFPVTFGRAPYPDRFFGANVAGALLGGLSENLSMLVGFRYLLLAAVLMYAISSLFGQASPTRNNPKADV